MKSNISIPNDKVQAFCRENHIRSLGLFGSATREDFGPSSDVDIIIEFEQDYKPGLMKLIELQDELSAIIGRKVDLVERQAVEKSQNYIRREHILSSVEPVYVAR